ncbi:MAG TPA: RND transporter [Kosmotogaceae bacterium]|nr:MAG: Exporter of the RND superfamily protein-like protein [Thermotogales bacterium 46_20]HAA85398.1 RND transporter [Kosmotogaceae bacterium]
MKKFSETVVRLRLPIISFFVIMGILGAYLSTRLVIDSDWLKILPDEDPIVVENQAFIDQATSQDTTYLVLKTLPGDENPQQSLRSAAAAIYASVAEIPHVTGLVRFDVLSDLGSLGLLMINPSQFSELAPSEQDMTRDLQRLINHDFSAINSLGMTAYRFIGLRDIIGDTSEEDAFLNYTREPPHPPEGEPMLLVMGMSMSGSSSELDYVARAIPELRQWLTEKLQPFNVTFAMAGNHMGAYESHKQANRDFLLTSILSLTGIALIFFAAYSSAIITFFIFASLAISMFITLGLAYILFGSLNIVTTFVNAITLGLGIDYGIHMITRLSDEARKESRASRVLFNTYSRITRPLLASMSTTLIVFCIVAAINAPAIRELGILTAIGIVVFFSTMYVFLPALSLPTISKKASGAKIHSLDRFFYRFTRSEQNRGPAYAAIVVGVLVILFYLGYVNLTKFTYTPEGLMSYDSESLSTARELELAFGGSIINTVPFVLSDLDELRAFKEEFAVNPYVKTTLSVLDLLEGGELDNLEQFGSLMAEAGKIRASPLVEAVLKKANYYDFAIEFLDRAEKIENSEQLMELIVEVLPETLREQFIYENHLGEQFFVLSVEPTANIFQNNLLKLLFDDIGDKSESAGGYPRVFYHIMDVIRKSAVPISLVAIAAIFVVVLIERKSVFDSLKVAILIGVILFAMFGMMEIMGIETSFITVVSAPLIIGIGVDSLVHMVHGSEKKNPMEAARTLKSVSMSSVTTMFAFLSFVFAQGRLLRQFGLGLAAGVFISLVVASILVPVLPWSEKRKDGG